MSLRLRDIKQAEVKLQAQELAGALKAYTLLDNSDEQGVRGQFHFNNCALLQAHIDGIVAAAFALGAPLPNLETLEGFCQSFGLGLVGKGRYDRFIVGKTLLEVDPDLESPVKNDEKSLIITDINGCTQ